MDQNEGAPPAELELQDEPVSMSMADFLESIPPNEKVSIDDLVHQEDWGISTPEIRLHCSDESCNGTRFFDFRGAIPHN